jgi:hypothetical protein
MIAVCVKPRSSSARRIAPTRPSIMSDGATTSAPAAACDSAACTRCTTVGSFRISSPSTMPQWPCEVYSQRQTSVMTRSSGSARLRARIASCTGASGSEASDPLSSLVSGRPNRITAPMPSARAAVASRTASSTESWNTPGIELTSSRTPSPPRTNSG